MKQLVALVFPAGISIKTEEVTDLFSYQQSGKSKDTKTETETETEIDIRRYILL